ncbi:unnamed protein product [Acanthosepion pharaonis]|uniref:Transposase n=1 Tax=Acanthosepion pharaonis TaxID=158019 RepID=A0A812DS31_ACAPH|nr:unnamed protein product [Sepia pharaonis]
MLIMNASKESRKVRAAALVNKLKYGSAGMLRFFSDTKIPSSIMVLGIISSEGDIMPLFFFQKGLRVTAEIYQEVLRSVVKPWMDEIATGRPNIFQHDSAPAHKAKTTQAWLLNNVPHHWSLDLCPPSSPDYKLLYFFWSVIKVDSLKAAIVEAFITIDKDMVAKACDSFRTRLEMLVAAGRPPHPTANHFISSGA